MVLLGAAAAATIIASAVINLKCNNKLLTDLAKKGYALKKGEMPAFRKEVKDIKFMNLIPIVNIGYSLVHSSKKYANRDAHFGNLIMADKIERIDSEKNDRLKAVSDIKRQKAMMKMRTRERLGLDAVSLRERTGATHAAKVKAKHELREQHKYERIAKHNPEILRKKAMMEVLSEEDEKTKAMLEAILSRTSSTSEPDKGRSR